MSNAPYKRYPAYKDSGVEWLGEIPAGWEVKKLAWLTVCLDGRRVPLNSIDRSTMRGEHPYWGANSIVDHVDRWLFDEELVLLGEDGAPFFDRTKPVAFHVNGRIWANNHVHVLRTTPAVGPAFLAYALNSVDYTNFIAGATRDKLTQGDMNAIPIELPSLREQSAIVAFLDCETARIDGLIAKKERLIELLQEQRDSLITRAVASGLDSKVRLQETGSLIFPQVPAHWELRKLRRVLKRVRRPVPVDAEEEYREIGIRSWGKGLFHKDAIKGALLEEKSVFSIEPGDFVLNIVFAWEGAVGVATEAERGMVASHRFPTYRVAADVDLDYVLMVLQTDQGRALMDVNSPGAAGRNRTIRLDQFLNEEVPIAPLEEQRAIVQTYRAEEARAAGLVAKVREAIQHLTELRTALISAAVTGKIDVRSEVA